MKPGKRMDKEMKCKVRHISVVVGRMEQTYSITTEEGG